MRAARARLRSSASRLQRSCKESQPKSSSLASEKRFAVSVWKHAMKFLCGNVTSRPIVKSKSYPPRVQSPGCRKGGRQDQARHSDCYANGDGHFQSDVFSTTLCFALPLRRAPKCPATNELPSVDTLFLQRTTCFRLRQVILHFCAPVLNAANHRDGRGSPCLREGLAAFIQEAQDTAGWLPADCSFAHLLD